MTRASSEFDLALWLRPGPGHRSRSRAGWRCATPASEWQQAGKAGTLLDWDSLAFEWPVSLARPGERRPRGSRLELTGWRCARAGPEPARHEAAAGGQTLALATSITRSARLQLDQPELQLQRGAMHAGWNVERWLPAQVGAGARNQAAEAQRRRLRLRQPAHGQLELGRLQLAQGRVSLLDARANSARSGCSWTGSAGISPFGLVPGKTVRLPLQLGMRLARDRTSSGGTLSYQGELTLPGRERTASRCRWRRMANWSSTTGRCTCSNPISALRSTSTCSEPSSACARRSRCRCRRGPGAAQLHGDGEVNRLRSSTLDPAERLLDWQSLGLRGLQLELERGALARLKVAETVLSDYYARVVIDPQGRINLQQLLRQPGTAPSRDAMARATARSASPPASAVTASPASPSQPRLEFGPIAFVRGQVDFHDHFIKPNYSAHLSELTGRLGGFSNRLVQGGGAPGSPA